MSAISMRNPGILRHAWAAAFAVLLLLMLMTGPPAAAQTSQELMNVQGRLFDNGGNPLTGNQNITFRIYDAATTPPGNLLFAEGPVVVATNNGYYNYNLGSNTGGGIPDNVFTNPNIWLEIQIAAEILTPRTRMVSSAYAFNADMVDGQHGSYYANASNINAGTVGSTYGGTGQNWGATAAGNVPYFTAGGTFGLSGAPAGAGQYLRSTSGTAMAWSSIQAGDLPAGSTVYLARNAADTSTAAAAAGYLYQFTNSSPAATGGLSVTSAAGNGLYATSAGQYGVYGRSTQNAATATGVYGIAQPPGLFDAIGVMGYSKPQDFYGYGGWFEGGWMGIYAVANGTGGAGTSYMGAQLNATNAGAVGNAWGVFCTASGGTGGNRVALHAEGSGGTTSYGVEALATGTGTTNYAVFANASGAATTNYGVFARASAAGTNWAGYFEGNVGLGGTAAAPELRLYEPNGSGTDYSALRAQAQGANITYTLPAADGTANQVLATNGAGSLSWISNPAGGAPVGAQYVTMALDGTLTSERVLTAGSGLGLTDGGANGNATLALGNLTANWTQGGAFDVTLNNAASELRILESAGATFYGTFDVGDLAGDQSYTFTTGGTVWTSGNDGTTSTLDADLLDGQDSTAFAPATGSNNYVQLQAAWPGTQQTGNANITASFGASEIRIGSQGGDATRNIYFYEGGSATGRYFQWNDADTYFRMNDCLKLMGGLASDLRITGDAIYLRNDGPDVSQYIYFYEGGSATGASLQWDDGNARFNFSANLNITGALLTNGTERISAAGTITNSTWNGNTIGVGYGGTGVTTLTANGVLYGNGAAAIQATAVGANETVLTGTGAAPAFSNDPTLSGVRTTGIGVRLSPYGTNPGETGEVRFRELVASGANYVGLKAPDLINADLTWVLPAADGTNGQVLSTNGTGTLAWTSNPVGGAPSGAQYVTLALDGTLTSERVLTAGSGIGITDGGANGNVTLALGNLTANWTQANAFDVVLNNASSELLILESAGATFYGSFDVGDLASDQTYTFTTGGTVMTSGNIGGTAFVQNGNSFGAMATCGTNDANALAFET
ncbi:MAG: hypothetical protein RDV41_08435, partial [Planctomycetota bacterium]|nr:hypothetical protein [Planctomycetota bacterium]